MNLEAGTPRRRDQLIFAQGLAFFSAITRSLSHEMSNVLAIVKEDETAQFGLWDIVPVADAYQFVVLSGSIDPQLPVLIEGWDNTPELFFIDTTTQPWTVTPQSPR